MKFPIYYKPNDPSCTGEESAHKMDTHVHFVCEVSATVNIHNSMQIVDAASHFFANQKNSFGIFWLKNFRLSKDTRSRKFKGIWTLSEII